jgi:hypothetical protein
MRRRGERIYGSDWSLPASALSPFRLGSGFRADSRTAGLRIDRERCDPPRRPAGPRRQGSPWRVQMLSCRLVAHAGCHPGGCAGGHAGPRGHTPDRFPQPAPSGRRWPGEGSAGGRSRRDTKCPSGGQDGRHTDRVVGSGRLAAFQRCAGQRELSTSVRTIWRRPRRRRWPPRCVRRKWGFVAEAGLVASPRWGAAGGPARRVR